MGKRNPKNDPLWTRAGQVWIFPKEPVKMEEVLAELANTAWKVISTFNKKCGNPDYCLFLGIHESSRWFARYTPILNNWGGTEFAAFDCGTSFVLPWSHQATKAFLLS